MIPCKHIEGLCICDDPIVKDQFGFTLITSWVLVSSETGAEFVIADQPGIAVVHEWLKRVRPAKSTQMNKCEQTVGHICSAMRVNRVELPHVQFEIITGFEEPPGADRDRKGLQEEFFNTVTALLLVCQRKDLCTLAHDARDDPSCEFYDETFSSSRRLHC